jgi:hypothetical protein
MTTDGLAQEAQRGFTIPSGCQQEVYRGARLIDRAIQVFPCAFHPHIGFVQSPAAAHGTLACQERLIAAMRSSPWLSASERSPNRPSLSVGSSVQSQREAFWLFPPRSWAICSTESTGEIRVIPGAQRVPDNVTRRDFLGANERDL